MAINNRKLEMKNFHDLFEVSNSARLMAAAATRSDAAAKQAKRMKVAKTSVAANQQLKKINDIKNQSAADAESTPISKGGPLALRTPPKKERDPKVAAALKNVPVNKKAPATTAQKQFQQNKDFGSTTQSSASQAAQKDSLAARADRKASLQRQKDQLQRQQQAGQEKKNRIQQGLNMMQPKNRVGEREGDATALGKIGSNFGSAVQGAAKVIGAATGLDKKIESGKQRFLNRLRGSQRPGLATGAKSYGVKSTPKKPADPWASSNKPADPWKDNLSNPKPGAPGNPGVRSSNASFAAKNSASKSVGFGGVARKPTSSALRLRKPTSTFKATAGSSSAKPGGLGAAARQNPALRSQLIKQRMKTEEFSDWREEFIFEVGKPTPTEKKKVIEPMSGTNTVIINPTPEQVMKESKISLEDAYGRVFAEVEDLITAKSVVDEARNGGISKRAETRFHKKLDTLVHDTFGKRKEEKSMKENHIAIAMGKELDDEGSMILNQLDQLEMHCKRMREVVKKPTMQVPAWVQSKITIATDYMDSVANYMSSKNEEVENFEIEEGVRPTPVDKPLNMKKYKERRRSLAGKEKSADARSRGHEGKTWADSGRTYSPDEAKSRRKNMSDIHRSLSYGTAENPDDNRGYPAVKTKNPKKLRKQKAMGELDKADFDALSFGDFIREYKTAAWQRKEGKNPKGGLNEKGRKSYEDEYPDSDLKAPQPEGGPRKKSFCARMGGMPGPMKDENGKPTRKALALRKWKC